MAGKAKHARPTESRETLARLADLARDIHARWTLCEQIEDRLNEIQRAGIWTVVGESDFTKARRRQLDLALDTLESIKAASHASHREQLERLEMLIHGAGWEVAEEVGRDLQVKLDKQRQLIQGFTERVADWQAKIEALRKQIEQARKVQAPILSDDGQVRQLEEVARQANRGLSEPNYDQLLDALNRLDRFRPPTVDIQASLERKEKEVREFTRQADLLLLKAPLDSKSSPRFHYTVLLRTPSEPGSHGINLQGSSTMVKQDHEQIMAMLDDLKAAVNSGLARKAEPGKTEGPETAPGLEAAPAVLPEVLPPRGEGAPVRQLVPLDDPTQLPSLRMPGELIQDLGDLMHRLIVPEAMQNYFIATPCSLTITTNDLELPWELMYAENTYLCLRYPIARMPMGRAVPRQPRLRGSRSKLRFLLLHADPTGKLSLAMKEIETIETRLKEVWKDRIEVKTLVKEQATGRELNKLMRQGAYDVIHYAGHAAFDEKDGDLSGLLLHGDEVFFAQKVRRLLEGRPLVFLNACESGKAANEKEPQEVNYLQGPAEGLASAFIYGGAVGCIGSTWPVFDDSAAEFAIEFYNRVLEGYTIGEAMRQTRDVIRKKFPNQITWAGYVLYGDPRFPLVAE